MPSVETLLQTAVALHRAGNIAQAKQAYFELLRLHPQQANANYNLGVIHLTQQLAVDSLPFFNAALEADPQEPLYWISYVQALMQAENYTEARLVLAYGLQSGLSGSEVDALQSALEHPGQAKEEELIALFEQQRYAELEQKTTALLERYPAWLTGWKILSDTLMVQGKDAREPAARALALNMGDAKEHCYYGLVLRKEGDLEAAANSFEQAIAIRPDYAAAYNNLGIIRKDLGHIEAGIASYRRALELNPHYADCYSNLLFCLTHSEHIEASDLFLEHQRYRLQYELPLQSHRQPHTNIRDAQRALKIGFVSADFREHSVANFFEPVLQQLAIYPDLSLYAYYNNSIQDAVMLRLRAMFTQWASVDTLTDDQLAEMIRSDGIDILIDLSGHTSGNRLLTFARKPAPVQATWLGYLYSTGLQAIDYYIGDTYLLPPGQFDHQFSEQLLQLTANAPFKPYQDAPLVYALPAISNGYVTFACFNRPNKINEQTVRLWSRVLQALPNSKMLIAGMPSDHGSKQLLDWFLQAGIAEDRLLFRARSNLPDYLALHHQVDLCLDTFPSNGVTTSCHAAWMGVPTLTMEGASLASRGAMAIMGHLGLSRLHPSPPERMSSLANEAVSATAPAILAEPAISAADDPKPGNSLNSSKKLNTNSQYSEHPGFVGVDAEDFVQIALYWAANLSQLANTRYELRQRFEQSALGRPEAVALSLHEAFKTVWHTWCKA